MSRVLILILSLCALSTLASDCVGSFSDWLPCDGCPCGGTATQSRFYEVSIPATSGGKACPHPHDFEESRACTRQCSGNNCVGEWQVGPCVSEGTCGSDAGKATRTYKHTKPAGPGGAACPIADGKTEQIACSAPVTPCACCVGDFGAFSACVSDGVCGSNAGHRSRTFKITQQAGTGGTPCAHPDGFVEKSTCAAPVSPCQDCVGAWSAYEDCKNNGVCNSPAGKRKRTYFISKQAGPGGQACPHTNGFVEESSCACPASEVTPCVDCKGSWSAYTPCKSKGQCGSAAGTRSRTFTITQQAGTGGQQCASKDGAVEVSDCAAEVTPCAGCEGSFGAWSACKSDGVCGSDAGKRTRTFTITKAGEAGGAKCAAHNGFVQEECCTAAVTPCPPEACVGGFGAVSKCKANGCGTVEGTQSRKFSIKTNAKHGGAICAHPHGFVETLKCEVGAGDVEPCPVDCDGDWGLATDCVSKGVCGKDWGYQFQTYHHKVKAAHGGKKCRYRDGYKKKMKCAADITPCPPRDCVGAWHGSPCKQNKCGDAAGESIEKFKITVSAKYGGKQCEARNGATRTVECTCPKVTPCPVCCIGEWSDFGPCKSAGKCSSSKGSRKRTFSISQKAAHGGAECAHKDGEVQVDHSCEAPVTPCPPEDCEGHWMKKKCIPEQCEKTDGLQKQTFKVTKKERYGGKVCAFKHGEKREVPCVAEHVMCPVKCVGAFSEFSACKGIHKCHSTKGEMSRTYTITQEAKYGGKECPRANGQVETEDCKVPFVPCPPEDCIGSWSEPTPCLQKECGKAAGTQQSTYSIQKQAKYNGTKCPAVHGEVKKMECSIVEDKIKHCPVDCVEKWSAWDKCVPTDCGCTAGTQKRKFEIVTPAAHGGKECKFAHGSTHTQPCEASVRDVERCPNALLDEPCEDLEVILKQSKDTRCKLEGILAALTGVAAGTPAPEPEATSAAPEPEATSAAPEPEATSAAPEPEATSAAPEPEATSAAPEPEATSAAPEPEATSAAPEPEATSAAPEPEATSAAPEPEATSAAPEPEATSAAPEPEATSAAPEPEATSAAPEPEATSAAPEPEAVPRTGGETHICGEKLGKPENECARFGMKVISKDDFDQRTCSRDSDLAMVKAGTCYTLYKHAKRGTALTTFDGKQISHVTYCRK